MYKLLQKGTRSWDSVRLIADSNERLSRPRLRGKEKNVLARTWSEREREREEGNIDISNHWEWRATQRSSMENNENEQCYSLKKKKKNVVSFLHAMHNFLNNKKKTLRVFLARFKD